MAKALKIKAQVDGFRRAGHAFSSTEEKTLLLSDLSKEQVEALKNEPKLLVVETDVEADGPKAGKNPDSPFASAAAEKLAAENGLSAETLKGTGPDGKITKPDVQAAIDAKK